MRTTQPIEAAGNGVYGSKSAQEDQLRAQPLVNAEGVINRQVANASQIDLSAGMPTGAPMPGDHGEFGRISERPGQPLTAAPTQQMNLGNEEMQNLKQYLPTLELLSTGRDSSQALRNFVRRIRGTVD